MMNPINYCAQQPTAQAAHMMLKYSQLVPGCSAHRPAPSTGLPKRRWAVSRSHNAASSTCTAGDIEPIGWRSAQSPLGPSSSSQHAHSPSHPAGTRLQQLCWWDIVSWEAPIAPLHLWLCSLPCSVHAVHSSGSITAVLHHQEGAPAAVHAWHSPWAWCRPYYHPAHGRTSCLMWCSCQAFGLG